MDRKQDSKKRSNYSEKIIDQVHDSIYRGCFDEAKKYLCRSRLSGLPQQEIFDLEEKIKAIEDNIASAEQNLRQENFDGAKTYFELVNTLGVPQHHTLKLENKIKVAEAERYIALAKENLDKDVVNEAKTYLNCAKRFGVLQPQILRYEGKIKAAEAVVLVEQNLLDGNLGDAKTNLRLAEQYNAPAEKTHELHNQIKTSEYIYSAEKYMMSAQELVSKGMFNEAQSCLAEAKTDLFLAKQCGATPEKLYELQEKVEVEKAHLDTERYIALAQKDLAKGDKFGVNYYVELAEKSAKSNIHRYQDKIRALKDVLTQKNKSNRRDKEQDFSKKTSETGIQTNDKMFDDLLSQYDTQENSKSADKIEQRPHIEKPAPKVKPTHILKAEFLGNTTSSARIKGHGNETVECGKLAKGQNPTEKVTGHQACVDMEKREGHKRTEYAENEFEKAIIKQATNKPALPEKPAGIALRKPKILEHPVCPEKHEPNKPELPKQTISQNNTRPENRATSEKPSNLLETVPKKPAIPVTIVTIETSDFRENPTTVEDPQTCADKCRYLAKHALADGRVDDAQKIVLIAQTLYPEADYSFLLEDINAEKQTDGNIFYNRIQNPIAAPKSAENHRYQTRSVANILADKLSGINIQGIHLKPTVTQLKFKPETKITETHFIHKEDDVSKLPKQSGYALKTAEKNAINKIYDEEIKNDYASASYAHTETPDNKDAAEECLKKASEAFESAEFAKAEKFALKADRMNPSEDAKKLLEKIHAAEKFTTENPVKTERKIGASPEFGEERSGDADRCLEVATAAFESENLVKCKRFLEKAKRIDPNFNIDEYMTLLNASKKQTESKQKAKEPSVKQSIVTNLVGSVTNYVRGCTKVFYTQKEMGENRSESKKDSDKYGNQTKELDRKTQTLAADNKTPPKKDDIPKKNNESDVEKMDTATGGKTASDDDCKMDIDIDFPEDPEETRRSKAERLTDEAFKRFEEQDFDRAEALITEACSIDPSPKTRDILIQILEENDKKKAKRENPNEPPEKPEGNTKNAASGSGTTTYDENKNNLDKIWTSHGKGRCRGRGTHHGANPPYPKPNLRERNAKAQKLEDEDTMEYKILRQKGIEAINREEYDEAEKFLMESEELLSDHVTKKWLNQARAGKNKASNSGSYFA